MYKNKLLPLADESLWSAKKYDLEGKTDVILMKIEPKGHTNDHTQPVNVHFYILAGQADFIIENELIKAEKHQMLTIPKNLVRRIVNSNQQALEIMVIKEKY